MAIDPSEILRFSSSAAPAAPDLETATKELVSTLLKAHFDNESANSQLSTLCLTPGFDINALKHDNVPLMNLLLTKGNFAAATLLVNWGADAANALWLAAGVDSLTVDSRAHRKAILHFVDALKIQEADQIRDNPDVVKRRIRAVLTKAHELAVQAQNSDIVADLSRLIEKPAAKAEAAPTVDTPRVASMKKGVNPESTKKKKKKILGDSARTAWNAKASSGVDGTKKKKAKKAPATDPKKGKTSTGKKGKTGGHHGSPQADARMLLPDESKRAILRQKMLPWERPSQGAHLHNKQKQMPMLL